MKDMTLQDATVTAACLASVRVTGTLMEPREAKVRWVCIRREVELAKCEFSMDCEGCRVAAWRDEVSGFRGQECQERIRVVVMSDNAGQQRLRAAEVLAASATRVEVVQGEQVSFARVEFKEYLQQTYIRKTTLGPRPQLRDACEVRF